MIDGRIERYHRGVVISWANAAYARALLESIYLVEHLQDESHLGRSYFSTRGFSMKIVYSMKNENIKSRKELGRWPAEFWMQWLSNNTAWEWFEYNNARVNQATDEWWRSSTWFWKPRPQILNLLLLCSLSNWNRVRARHGGWTKSTEIRLDLRSIYEKN